MVLSLGQAAKAIGRSKSALSRDVKAGRISATRNADGSLSIDPSELFRVFRPLAHGPGAGNGGWDESQPPGNAAGTAATVRERAPDPLALYLRLAKAEAERDLLRAQVVDLRTRLDASEGERRQMAEDHRRLQAQLTGLLTDRRDPAAAEPAPASEIKSPPPPVRWPCRVVRWLVKQHTA